MTAFQGLTILCALQWGIYLNNFDVFASTPAAVTAQLIWTPIYVGGTSQVDLWTQSTEGCACSFNSTRTDCACCVQSGGCSCGESSPHRCAQCGLEQNCASMCNMTLDSKQLLDKSGRGFGQIKSPALTGPTRCTYRFIPDTGQRVELQIYRLVSIGRHNGSACEGGWLQLEKGAMVCGRNERFDPPVVLFSDDEVATLDMRINEKTVRSQFLAYFSFTSTTSTSVGWPGRGGKPVNNTACDWVYEDTDCRHKDCVIATPGYPGVYASNSRCRYLVTSGPRVSVTIKFNAVMLPHNHCATDYIAVYSGTATSSPLLVMLCGGKNTTVIHSSPNILIEFRSGPGVPPFDYNGFVATLGFVEITTESPTTPTPEIVTNKANDNMMKSVGFGGQNVRYMERDPQDHRREQKLNSCDLEVRGDEIRSGNHDTRGKPKSTVCRLVLRGGSYDSVHVSLASYNLSAPACRSMIEIFDGPPEGGTTGNGKSLERICSPVQRTMPQDPAPVVEKYLETERYSSTGREMTVVLRRSANTSRDEEFMDVVYYFHDEREGGTQQPASVCDVEYFGLSSPKNGSVVHPAPHRLFAMEGALKCRQHFIPAANQSVIITLQSTNRQISNSPCDTQCGDSGCRCFANKTLDEIDHLQLVSETGHIVSCLCGSYQDWLPVGIRSWTPVYIEWSRSSRAGLDFKATYRFADDAFCGDHSTTRPEGEVSSGDLANEVVKLNSFYQQKCTWVLDSTTDRQLTVEVESNQSKPCTAWNLTIHEYSSSGDPAGPRLHTFCSRDRHRNFTLPWKMNTVVVRLQALSRTAPQYVMRWRSDAATANTRKSGPSPAPNQVIKSSGQRWESTNIVIFTSILQALAAFLAFPFL
ncbi:uncharacterized protein LOC105690974 [Athalia rosae]|uniref:uncharacterized protein LOC105690974 n=1 Tax=Athalia rosae TaxID=37344 RepID=UPI002033A0E7|nr:uncharacterized protein LOC105690974 [Athalia rosae]XP_048512323.1 uncharacterized protein LOC105690974 [Athalia rosae]XP_048512324.1 uncharacterized protein LOC105690974 [Athalia rosae]XP_048512325.1 uncharacterized protein LOC105690974 [Athalia rosae]XP_048512326.1 uncharacterized protein LOC105690974 [Athalia rosae]